MTPILYCPQFHCPVRGPSHLLRALVAEGMLVEEAERDACQRCADTLCTPEDLGAATGAGGDPAGRGRRCASTAGRRRQRGLGAGHPAGGLAAALAAGPAPAQAQVRNPMPCHLKPFP